MHVCILVHEQVGAVRSCNAQQQHHLSRQVMTSHVQIFEQEIRHDDSHLFAQVSVEEARERIKAINEPYKLEILEGIVARHPDASITIYHTAQQNAEEHWWDLCAGPHVETTKDINPAAIDLESIAGRLTACKLLVDFQ